MGSTILGVILDSSVVIEADRRRFTVTQFLRHIAGKIGDREDALSPLMTI